jgi:hypothetical protein
MKFGLGSTAETAETAIIVAEIPAVSTVRRFV